ncbi:MAG: cytochrome c oxidase subunit [Acidobacteriota bacterium]|nr:cytochrome c oxidase subunit [Acidobacteriota bacterium]
MSTRTEGLKGAMDKQEIVLNAICLLFAAAFLFLSLSNLRWAGNFLSIDSLFMTIVFGLLALIFLINPVYWAWKRGLFESAFGAGTEADYPAEEVHFAGSTKLFFAVLTGLLALTIVEVILAYIQMSLKPMLAILIGLSLIKAAMILGYFMHLKYERMSLVFTLIPALVICICLMFILFPDSNRNRNLRTESLRAIKVEAEK